MTSKKQLQETASASCTLYILRCKDATLYTGITRDLARRIRQHNSKRGARYTMTRGPVTIVFQHVFTTHAEAARVEIQIKRASKIHRERLVAEGWGYFEKHREFFGAKKKAKGRGVLV